MFDCTIVEVLTDARITGWGEVCPLGPFYLPAYGPARSLDSLSAAKRKLLTKRIRGER